MHRGKSIAYREHMIATSSSSSNDDNNVSLRADQKEAPASTYNAASSSAVSQRRGGVPSQRDPFTSKYEAHWKDGLSL
jgi:hypothetical protein